jgi:hypothetical protein
MSGVGRSDTLAPLPVLRSISSARPVPDRMDAR